MIDIAALPLTEGASQIKSHHRINDSCHQPMHAQAYSVTNTVLFAHKKSELMIEI